MRTHRFPSFLLERLASRTLSRSQEFDSVHAHIAHMVSIIHDNDLKRRTSQEAVRAVAKWQRDMLDALTVDSLHEMGITAARLLGRRLVRLQEASDYNPTRRSVREQGPILVRSLLPRPLRPFFRRRRTEASRFLLFYVRRCRPRT